MPVIHFKTFLNKLNFELRRLFSGNEKGFLDPNSKVSNFWRRSITSIQKAKIARSSGLISSILLVLLSFSVVFPIYVAKDKTEAVGTASTTTLTITNAVTTAAVDLSVMSANGTFAVSSSNIAFEIKTNNYTGYTVSLSPKTSSTALTNNVKNNATNTYATFTSIGSSMSESTFSADTEAAGTAYNGKWGVKPSKYNSTTNSNYLPSPTSSSAMLIEKTTSPNASTANTYTIGIGARAGYEQAAGTYSNTYVLTLTGNLPEYTITYKMNNGTSTNYYTQSGVAASYVSSTSVSLYSGSPTRTGYIFLGWCSTSTSSDTCSGTKYQPGDTFAFDYNYQTANANTLYAIWGLSMQNLTLNACKVNVGIGGNATNIGDNIRVYDVRDRNDYTVRYINGQCWMTQNLRFTGASLKATTTNIVTDKNITYYDLTVHGGDNGYCYGNGESGGSGYSYACIHDSENVVNGVWYNYAAASAMTITGIQNSSVASQDICPKNWHLPTAPSTTDGTNFAKLLGSTKSGYQDTPGANAFGAVLDGYYDNGQLLGDTGGYYWSSAPADGYRRYNMRYDADKLGALGTSHGRRYLGRYVRCVLSS